ncbi:M56 family metallopeptidase [Microbacteriaceae bacterium 4G12]
MVMKLVNTYLPSIFEWILETSIMASVLVGFILCVKVLLRRKLTPRWDYLLWMILIVRLLLPWSPTSSYSIYSLLLPSYPTTTSIQSPPTVFVKDEALYKMKGTSNPDIVESETVLNDITPQASGEMKEKPSHNEKQQHAPLSIHTIASYIWLLGTVILGFTTYFINRRLHRYIQRQPAITDERVISVFQRCKESMSIQEDIPLLLAGKLTSPTVFGFFRPQVLLSNEHLSQLNEQQLQHIFHHELAHIKRRDIAVNWLMHSLLLLNWFNPILWYANSRMREDQEIACDALALTFMEEKEQISYGHTIISLLEHYSRRYPAPSLAGLSRNKKALRRRIFMIKKFQKKSYRWSVLGIMTIIAVSSFSLFNAHADETKEQPKSQGDGKSMATGMKEENTVYTPPKQPEYLGDMTKEEILTKMINTVDYFETAIGEFKTNLGSPSGEMVTEYEISLHDKAGGYGRNTYYQENKTHKVTSRYYNNGTIWNVMEDVGAYQEMKNSEETFAIKHQPLTIENAFSVNHDGDNVTHYRERPPSVGEHLSLFPYEIASNFTRDLNRWEIEKQNEELVGHNTLVIKGRINRREAKSFRFWVDKDTGILVKYETYDATGKVVDYLHPNRLEVNAQIDSKKFTPNLEGYQKEDMFGKDQRRMTTGNIDNLIPEELKAQWEEAKKKPDETTVLQYEGKWYICAKKGYLVNYIKANGKEGTLVLSKTSPQKSQSIFHALAEGYEVESLKVVYE